MLGLGGWQGPQWMASAWDPPNQAGREDSWPDSVWTEAGCSLSLPLVPHPCLLPTVGWGCRGAGRELHSSTHTLIHAPPYLRPEDPKVPGLRRGPLGLREGGNPHTEMKIAVGPVGRRSGARKLPAWLQCPPHRGLLMGCPEVLRGGGVAGWGVPGRAGEPGWYQDQHGIRTSTGSAPSKHLAVSQ